MPDVPPRSYAQLMGRIFWQFVGVLLLIGVVGAYFWPIAVTLAAAYLSYQVVLRALMASDGQQPAVSKSSRTAAPSV
jgi:hypothetical protein